MGLLQKLKSALGLGGTGSSESGRSDDVSVTVEREPSTEDEDAVKGTETASSGVSAADDDTEAAAGDDAESPSADDGGAADANDASADDDDVETAPATDDTAATDEGDSDVEETADAADGSTDPVTELKGIGPAYGDRLAGAGIETIGELAVADPADLAEEVDLGESRVADWVERANAY